MAKGRWGRVEYSRENLVIIADIYEVYKSNLFSIAHIMLCLVASSRSSLKLSSEELVLEPEPVLPDSRHSSLQAHHSAAQVGS